MGNSSHKQIKKLPFRSKKKSNAPNLAEQELSKLISKGPIENFYDVKYDQILGRGHYAVVNLGVNKKTNEQVAVKRIAIKKSRLEALHREVSVLQQIGHHPNIVTLHDIFLGNKGEELLLVMELLKGGELFDRMVERGPYSEQEASHHIRKIGLALKFLHRNGIVHRDLKPENLILESKADDAELKIADFGLSKIVDNVASSTMNTICGTWAYCAPEVKTSVQRIKQPGTNATANVACYTAAVDLWSVGVILFVILGAYHPFDPEGVASDQELWNNICSGEFDFDDPAWDGISLQAKDLIRKLIVVDPEKRYTTDDLLTHPWVTLTASVPATPITPTIDRTLKTFREKKPRTPRAFGAPGIVGNVMDVGVETRAMKAEREQKNMDAEVIRNIDKEAMNQMNLNNGNLVNRMDTAQSVMGTGLTLDTLTKRTSSAMDLSN
eukprot:snap_masked-scaffold_24-processed-gene-3.22-mRNA-1 protein AED:0.09 eAED:0.09 QI:0/-1/0/1/-1/1/1/0/438